MTQTLRIILNPGYDAFLAWEQLEAAGCEVLFSTDEEDRSELVVKTDKSEKHIKKMCPFVKFFALYELPNMDYAEEWARHAFNFKDGKIQLELSNKTLYLEPGAGFGDLSHPTTRLCLELMKGQVENQIVIDIGSGSGILALAAVLEGATSAIGIDIDPSAVLHAEMNARLNHLERKAHFYLPKDSFRLNGSIVALMNMITSEQIVAWKAFIEGREVTGKLISSGVLEEQKKEYAALAKQFGWTIEAIEEKDGWLGFVMTF